MEKVDASDLLAQLAFTADMPEADFKATEQSSVKTDFCALLKVAIDHVNDIRDKAYALGTSRETGDPNVSLTEMMAALQKADVSFQAMSEVHDKLVSAYRDVMNMPI